MRKEIKGMYSCAKKHRCPHLNFEPVSKVLYERDYLRKEVDRLNIRIEWATQELICKDQQIAEKDKKIDTLEKKIKNLQNEIKQTHQAPFKKMKKRKKEEEDIPSRKQKGAPQGHIGGGRKKSQQVTRVKDVYADKGGECGSSHINFYENMQPELHTQEDIELKVNPVRKLTPFRDLSLTGLTRGIKPRVRQIRNNPVASHGAFSNGVNKITTLFKKHWYYCQNCGKVFVAPPQKGEIPNARIGPHVRAIEAILKYKLKLPLRHECKKYFLSCLAFL